VSDPIQPEANDTPSDPKRHKGEIEPKPMPSDQNSSANYPKNYDPLQALIELFRDVEDAGPAGPARADLTLEERLRSHIIDGEKEDLIATLDTARETYTPLEIINDHLLDGMKTVGELFGSGRMQLPFVLQSAEVMKMAVGHLEQFMEKKAGSTKGKIVLATVKGDVHDIGKNLVDIILSNNGYTVHNIGIKQPIADILSAWRATGADAIGLSGLLVKSVNVMEDNLREMNAEKIDVPVILGGAALTRHYAEGHLRSIYEGECFYGKDAFEGLRLMDAITTGRITEIAGEINARLTKRSNAEEVVARSRAEQATRAEAFEQSKRGATATLEAPANPAASPTAAGSGANGAGPPDDEPASQPSAPARSDVRRDIPIPTPPFWGSRVVENIPLSEIYPFINPVALFRGQWQFKKGALSDPEYQQLLDDQVHPLFERMKARCAGEKILEPRLVYGYYPCASAGDDLVIYHPTDHEREIERFRFPRQQGKRRLCISDYFRAADSGQLDVIGFHCVTMGPRCTEVCRNLFEAGDFREYLYLHGMGVETAEGLAEMWHKRIRQELGIAGDDSPLIKQLFQQKYRGSRFSPGYPACPDMSDQDIIWRLLEPERIGCILTENHQIDPEQSTSAFVVHHPEAKYFNV